MAKIERKSMAKVTTNQAIFAMMAGKSMAENCRIFVTIAKKARKAMAKN